MFTVVAKTIFHVFAKNDDTKVFSVFEIAFYRLERFYQQILHKLCGINSILKENITAFTLSTEYVLILLQFSFLILLNAAFRPHIQYPMDISKRYYENQNLNAKANRA